MNIRTGIPMRSRSILPLRRALIDANMPDPGKVERKPFVPAKSREQLANEACYSDRQLRAGYVKFLDRQHWPAARIAEKVGVGIATVNRILYKGGQANMIAVEPPWFEGTSD